VPNAPSNSAEKSPTGAPSKAPPKGLKAQLEKAVAERDTYRQLYLDTLELCRRLEIGLLRGRERETGNDQQTSMALLGLMRGDMAPEASPPSGDAPASGERKPRAKPTGRQVLPEKLPRVDVEVLPPEVKARGTDAFERIGEDVTETIERRSASLVVVRTIKGKYVEKSEGLPQQTEVLQAEPPELPIERGLAGPGMLADTIVRRWEDHLPLHRLERIYGREGLSLSRSTICGWHMELARLCEPLLAAMWLDAMLSPYLCMDATGVLVQDREKCRNAHFFVVAAPDRHVLFGYSPKHNKAAVDQLLDGYKGYLVADAHAVYDHLFADGQIVEVGCWAHARRYVFRALSTDPPRARHALKLINQLFVHERTFASLSPEQRKQERQRLSVPILDEYEAWCDAQVDQVVDESPIAKAIRYSRNHRAALRRFLDDGRLPIHNNWSERELRREAVGRSNWLFVGSDEGGEVNATFVSLLASARLHKHDPLAYLRDLLCLLPSWPACDVLQLAPVNWAATSERPEVRRLLESNIYRSASLGLLPEKPPSGAK
jgi:transposase